MKSNTLSGNKDFYIRSKGQLKCAVVNHFVPMFAPPPPPIFISRQGSGSISKENVKDQPQGDQNRRKKDQKLTQIEFSKNVWPNRSSIYASLNATSYLSSEANVLYACFIRNLYIEYFIKTVERKTDKDFSTLVVANKDLKEGGGGNFCSFRLK